MNTILLRIANDEADRVATRIRTLVKTVSIMEHEALVGVDLHITTHMTVWEMKKWLEVGHIDYLELKEI